MIDKLDWYLQNSSSQNGTLLQGIQITINGNIEDFDTTKREYVVRVIAAILEINEDSIKVHKVLKGSIKIVLQFPVEKAKDLVRLFESNNKSFFNKLPKDIKIENVEMVNFDDSN